MKPLLCFLLLSLSLLGTAGQNFILDVDIDNPPGGILSDDWSEMLINGEKVGYSHSRIERRKDVIVTSEESYMQMGRGSSAITSLSKSVTTEMIDGTPVSHTNVTREGERRKTQQIQFTPEGVLATINDGIRSWTREFALESGYVLSWSYIRQIAKAEMSAGDTLESRIYVPDLALDQTLLVTTTLVGPETIPVRGTIHEATRIEQTLQLGFLPLKLTAWIEENGRLLKMDMPFGGMNITLVGSTEEEAKASFSPPDLFTETLIPLNRIIPENAQTVTFLVRSSGEVITEIPDSAFQSVRRIDEGTYEVKVRRGSIDFRGSGAVDPAYLEPTPIVDFDDPAIMALLEEADLDSLSPEDRVRTLVRIADDAIAIKSMDLGFATASESVALSEGDCTEHALLLAALGRAAGFPARGASGVIYFTDDEGDPVMGYHMWTQFWNGTEWLDVDAAFGAAETAPIRILFSTTDLSDPSLLNEVLTLAQFLGQTEIRISSVSEELPD